MWLNYEKTQEFNGTINLGQPRKWVSNFAPDVARCANESMGRKWLRDLKVPAFYGDGMGRLNDVLDERGGYSIRANLGAQG